MLRGLPQEPPDQLDGLAGVLAGAVAARGGRGVQPSIRRAFSFEVALA